MITAYSFIEYSDSKIKKESNYNDSFLNMIFKNNFSTASQFYAQPFNRDLIQKYFVGWALAKEISLYMVNTIYMFNSNSRHICFIEDKLSSYECKGIVYTIEFPVLCLDDFIRDCRRIGIVLEFKEN